MESTKKLAGVLNSLVRINNDRQDGYQLAARETTDSDLKNLFAQFASDSAKFRDELIKEVNKLGEEEAKDTTVSGKMYRAWMDIKSALTGRDRHAILSSCEFGEDAALEAYDDSLKADVMIPSDVRELIHLQRLEIRKAHDRIKAMRDSEKVTEETINKS